jgi:hypothetical protein
MGVFGLYQRLNHYKNDQTNAYSNTRPVIKIMPLGDSLTAGEGDAGYQSYRGHLYKMLKDNGHGVDFVGNQTSPSPPGTDDNHEGHAGYTIGPDDSRYCYTQIISLICSQEKYNIYDNIDPWLNSAEPDIILLLVGINDLLPQTVSVGSVGINRPVNPNTAGSRLEGLVTKILTSKPNVKIILSTLLRVSWRDGSNWEEYRAFNKKVNEIATTNQRVYLADLDTIQMNADDYYDSLHLNSNGAYKVAQGWYNILTTLLVAPIELNSSALLPIWSTQNATLIATSTSQPVVFKCESNLLANGAFDDLNYWDNWNGVVITDTGYVGNALQVGPEVGGAGQMLPAGSGSSYTLMAWARKTGKPNWAGFGLAFWDGSNSKLAMYSIDNIGDTFQFYTLTAVSPIGTKRAQVWAWTNGEDGTLMLDEVCLLPSWAVKDKGRADNPTQAPPSTSAQTATNIPKIVITPKAPRVVITPTPTRRVVNPTRPALRATPTVVRKR